MLEPSSDILPSMIEFVLLRLADDLGRPCNVLLLDNSLSLHVIALYLHLVLLRHRDHLQGLEVLRLPPLREGCATIAPPVHIPDLGAALVLVSCQLLVPGELSDVLEASLPDRFLNDSLDASSEMPLTFGVITPRPEDESQPALEVIILIELSHECHDFAALDDCLVEFGVCNLRLVH